MMEALYKVFPTASLYKYYDMDDTIMAAFDLLKKIEKL